MPIPASHIVDVTPRVIGGGSSDLEFNGLFLTDSDRIPVDSMVMGFTSARSVGDYFGMNSKEFDVADGYFAGYDNKFSSPRRVMFSRRIDSPVSGWVRGGRVFATLNQIKAISSGEIVVEIDGVKKSSGILNFSSATTQSDVAEIIQAGLTGTVVSFDSLSGAFKIKSVTVGKESLVSFPDASELSIILSLTETNGAIVSQGSDALSVFEQMNKITDKSQNWVSFTTVDAQSIEQALEYAEWASKNYGYLYVAYNGDPVMTVAESDADMASALKASGLDNSCCVYGTVQHAAFIMGTVACIAWNRINGTITVAFKRQSGLQPWVVNESVAATLEAKNCNYFGNFATRNAEFVFMYPGVMSSSDYGFIDTYVNSVWFNNRLQVSLMDGISRAGRVPYNERGYNMIIAWMMAPVNEAKINAAIEPGVVLSERQKSELTNEAGLDISNELWTTGYYIQVLDPGATVRAERGSPIVSVWYCYGGAVQKIEVASTAVI